MTELKKEKFYNIKHRIIHSYLLDEEKFKIRFQQSCLNEEDVKLIMKSSGHYPLNSLIEYLKIIS